MTEHQTPGCPDAGTCTCMCRLNKFLSCREGKGHCYRTWTGCHMGCMP